MSRNDLSCMLDVEQGKRRSRTHARQSAEEADKPSEAMGGSGVGRLPQQSHPPPHKLVQRLSVKDCIDEGRFCCLHNNFCVYCIFMLYLYVIVNRKRTIKRIDRKDHNVK